MPSDPFAPVPLTPEHVRTLLAQATPGPWQWAHHGTHEVEAAPNQRIADCGTIGRAEGDARLMARARDLASALLATWEERDRLARVLRVEQGDESAAPRGWRARVYGQMGGVEWTRGAWVAVSEGHVVNDVALRRYRLHKGGKDPIRSTRGIFDFALDAMEAAAAARRVSDAE